MDKIFVPNILGVSSVAHTVRALFSLLAKLGVLGVQNSIKISNLVFSTSGKMTSCLIISILSQEGLNQHEISKEKP